MKAEPPPLRIAKPCPKNWGEMSGDAKRRFCEQCQLHVHNLSAMKAGERAQFVEQANGRVCITYELREDGTMITPSRWDWALRPLRAIAAVLAAMLPFAFSSCATRRTAGVPVPPGTPVHTTHKNPESRTLGIVAPQSPPPQITRKTLGKVAIMGEVAPPKDRAKPE